MRYFGGSFSLSVASAVFRPVIHRSVLQEYCFFSRVFHGNVFLAGLYRGGSAICRESFGGNREHVFTRHSSTRERLFWSVLFWWEYDMPVPPSAAPGSPKYAGTFWAVRGTPKNAGTFSVGMRYTGTAYLGSPEYVGTFSAVQKYSGSSKFFQ